MNNRGAIVAAATIILMIVVHAALVMNSAGLARYLPLSNLIVIGNFQPILVGFLAGFAPPRISGGSARKWATLIPLIALSAAWFSMPILGSPPECLSRWDGDVCLQSNRATCSPAAAATLLRAAHIPAEEGELAALCLTREGGTPLWGVYRGLKLKTAGTKWEVQVVSDDLSALKSKPGPLFIHVRLPGSGAADPRYERDWSWVPGVTHSVVVFGFTGDGRVKVGDPSVGLEHWTERDLEILWTGEGFRLVARGS